MELVLGIDLGTSYFKLGLFDRAGNLCGLGRVAVQKDASNNGLLCELSPNRFWELLREGLDDACAQANAHRSDIQALAYSSQANSFLLLDKNNRPLTPLILWPDSRDEKIDPVIQQLWNRSDFLKTTGIGIEITPQFCLSKLRSIQQNHRAIWKQVNRIMTISDYLIFCITGEAIGDMSTAALLGIFDIPRKQWQEQVLEAVGIQLSQLSTPLSPGSLAGKISREGEKYLGLKAGIPFAVGGLDHYIAAIGAGVGQIADLSESTGTVLACVNFSRQYQPANNRCIGPGVNGSYYYQLAFSGNGACVLEWYQKKYAPDMSIEELVKEAEKIESGSQGLIALCSANEYEGLKGFRNIEGHHTRGHFVRAIMESTAASLAELVDGLCGKERPKRIVATGGGAKSDLWLRIKADMLGVEFVTTECAEPACLGASMLAAVATKWVTNTDKASESWISIKKTFQKKPA